MRLEGFNRTLFQPGQRVCCALSGGADSTALLLALLEANAEKESLGVVLSAVHVHHGLRGPEADEDERFVRLLCESRQVPLRTYQVDTRGRQAGEGEGLEEAARELRYASFRQHLAEGLADAVATAHTLDDQAETVVMKLLRGTWTEGLGGISPILDLATGPAGALGLLPQGASPPGRAQAAPSLRVLRPMLAVPRSEVERFLEERHQPWREDSSNKDMQLTRNRVRHEVMPLLRSFNPSLAATLGRTAAIAREEELFWKTEVDRLLPALVLPGKPVRGGGRAVSTAVGERSLALEIERLKSHPAPLQRRLVRAAAASLGCRPNAEETAKLLALAGLQPFPGLAGRNGARLELGNGLRAERSVRELRLSRVPPPAIP